MRLACKKKWERETLDRNLKVAAMLGIKNIPAEGTPAYGLMLYQARLLRAHERASGLALDVIQTAKFFRRERRAARLYDQMEKLAKLALAESGRTRNPGAGIHLTGGYVVLKRHGGKTTVASFSPGINVVIYDFDAGTASMEGA